jgi:hypothetical protein
MVPIHQRFRDAFHLHHQGFNITTHALQPYPCAVWFNKDVSLVCVYSILVRAHLDIDCFFIWWENWIYVWTVFVKVLSEMGLIVVFVVISDWMSNQSFQNNWSLHLYVVAQRISLLLCYAFWNML